RSARVRVLPDRPSHGRRSRARAFRADPGGKPDRHADLVRGRRRLPTVRPAEDARLAPLDSWLEPVLEPGRGYPCILPRGERVLAELCAGVSCVDVGDHPAWVVAGAQEAPRELVETERI